jgi:hypothetical protein
MEQIRSKSPELRSCHCIARVPLSSVESQVLGIQVQIAPHFRLFRGPARKKQVRRECSRFLCVVAVIAVRDVICVVHCTKTSEQNVHVFIDHYTIEDLTLTLQRRKLAGIIYKDTVRTAQ